MMNMEGGLTRAFTFMLGVSGLIFVTMVLPDDVTSIGYTNYLYSMVVLKGGPVLECL